MGEVSDRTNHSMAGIRQDEVHPLSRDGGRVWHSIWLGTSYSYRKTSLYPLSALIKLNRQENITLTGSFATTIAWDEDSCSSFILGGNKENVVFCKSSLFSSHVRPITRHLLTSESPSLFDSPGIHHLSGWLILKGVKRSRRLRQLDWPGADGLRQDHLWLAYPQGRQAVETTSTAWTGPALMGADKTKGQSWIQGPRRLVSWPVETL